MATIAPHYMHVYQRPRQGTAEVAQYKVAQYRHRLVANGGYDSASCALNVRKSEAEWIFSNLIGCVVRFHADNPMATFFEGYIERITYRTGSITFTKSLENMANRVNVTYYNTDSAAAFKTEDIQTAIGTVIENTQSQAIFGLKMLNFDAGVHHGTSRTHKNLLRQTMQAIRAWPQISVAYGGENSGAIIEVEVRGLHYMAWDWEQSIVTSGLNPDANIAFERLTVRTTSPIHPQNAPYIYLTGPTSVPREGSVEFIAVNAAFTFNVTSSSGQTYLQQIASIAEAGDGSTQYVYGITPPKNDGNRYVYYQPASSVVKYNVNALRDTGRIRDIHGRILPGWEITPDGVFETMDIRLGFNAVGDDPRSGYIQSVEYDGETGQAAIQSGDNVTMEGVLQRDRYFKAHSGRRAFGAPLRQTL
jgi:hypothetical protein